MERRICFAVELRESRSFAASVLRITRFTRSAWTKARAEVKLRGSRHPANSFTLAFPFTLPPPPSTLFPGDTHAKQDRGKCHAGARVSARPERVGHRRGRRAELDVELHPAHHAHPVRGRGRLFRRAQARGGRRQPVHDRVPGRRGAGRDRLCRAHAGPHRAGRGRPRARILRSPPRLPVRHPRGADRRRLPAVARRGHLRRRRLPAPARDRGGRGLAGARRRAGGPRPASGRDTAGPSGARRGVRGLDQLRHHAHPGHPQHDLRRGRDLPGRAHRAGPRVAANADPAAVRA